MRGHCFQEQLAISSETSYDIKESTFILSNYVTFIQLSCDYAIANSHSVQPIPDNLVLK